MLWKITLGFIMATAFGGIIINPLKTTKFSHGSNKQKRRLN